MLILIHLANVLYLISYLVKDILWLRVVSCLAGLSLIISCVRQPELPWVSLGWTLVFFVINSVHIRILLRERSPVNLREEEQRLYALLFRSLRPREFLRLLAIGAFRDHAAGEVLVARGAAPKHIMVIVDGGASVQIDGRSVVELGPGKFIGEMSFLTGEVPGADVQTSAATRVVVWRTDALNTFLEANPEVRAAIQLVLGTDLVAKLKHAPSPRR